MLVEAKSKNQQSIPNEKNDIKKSKIYVVIGTRAQLIKMAPLMVRRQIKKIPS